MKATILFIFLSALCVHVISQSSVSTWLDGSKSVGCDKVLWKQVSGPVQVSMKHTDSLMCQATFTKEGEYKFRLRCANPYGSDSDEVRVVVVKDVLALDETPPFKPDRPKKLELIFIQQTGKMNIHFRSPQSVKVDVAIYDMMGRRLYQGVFAIRAGDSDGVLPLRYQPGIYVLIFRTARDKIVKKIVITGYM